MKFHHRSLRIVFALTFLLIAGNAGAQSITIGTVSGSQFCTGDSISVHFTPQTCVWPDNNVFTLQLSDPNGSFASGGQNIGSRLGTENGTPTVYGRIPGNIGSSTHYRVRVFGEGSFDGHILTVASPDNGRDIAIGTGPGGFSFMKYLQGGATGTPITFTATGEINDSRDSQDNAFWDFGLGATPPKATTTAIVGQNNVVSFSQNITFSRPGDKTVTLSIAKPGGCSTTIPYELHIYDCSKPSIPHNAIVINSDTTLSFDTQPSRTYWVNPGVQLKLLNLYGRYGDSTFTIFAEPGSTISGSVFHCVLYMKHDAVVTSTGNSSVLYGDGARINSSSSDFTLNCPTLDFDYSNAPPNVAHPLAVRDELKSVSITLSPNPTRGMVQVQGLPAENTTVSVFNILGEVVGVQKNLRASEFTLDLSKLVSGTYYIRISSASSVVTKKVVRE